MKKYFVGEIVNGNDPLVPDGNVVEVVSIMLTKKDAEEFKDGWPKSLGQVSERGKLTIFKAI